MVSVVPSPPSSSVPRLLLARSISKRFPGVLALDSVSLELSGGEVLALVGENGAGKSTLIKILGGILTPDSGEIFLEGHPVCVRNVTTGKALGIALIHQEPMLAPNLDIAANVFLGEEHRFSHRGALSCSRMNAAAEVLLKQVGLDLPPATPLSRLSTAQRQLVEIAKALALNARIVIMDEPTASLTPMEAERLFEIISDLRCSGIALLYVSHRMEEILRVASRITVLRDGRRVGDLDAKATTRDEIVSFMIGREYSAWFPQRSQEPEEPILEVKALRVPGTQDEVSFAVRRAEILGFAGLVGSGRTELMRVLFGVDACCGGTVRRRGSPCLARSSKHAIELGIGFVPEDRKVQGLVLTMSVTDNISLPAVGQRHLWGRLWRAREHVVAQRQVARLHIRTANVRQPVLHLSGGNQQKVVLGKWLAMQPQILILDEPTRGIDVGAKADIYRQIVALADSGTTILLVSSDMEELLGLSDRVVVMHERRIAGILAGEEVNETNIANLMTGNPHAR